MISKAYENPDFCVVEFDLEDVLTSSAVVHTTQPSTTIPTTTLPTTTVPTTQSGFQVGGNGQGDIVFRPSEYFQ